MAGSILSIPGGIRAARVILGMKGHRPSAKNIAIGKCMKASGAKPTNGGRYDTAFQRQFVTCAQQAGFNLGARGRAFLSRG